MLSLTSSTFSLTAAAAIRCRTPAQPQSEFLCSSASRSKFVLCHSVLFCSDATPPPAPPPSSLCFCCTQRVRERGHRPPPPAAAHEVLFSCNPHKPHLTRHASHATRHTPHVTLIVARSCGAVAACSFILDACAHLQVSGGLQRCSYCYHRCRWRAHSSSSAALPGRVRRGRCGMRFAVQVTSHTSLRTPFPSHSSFPLIAARCAYAALLSRFHHHHPQTRRVSSI
jgi:hypothetical protein